MAFLDIQPVEAGIADPKNYGAKPLFFFDIDGVFNRIPFLEVYMGPLDCDCRGYCPHRSDPANWQVMRTEFGEDLFDDVPETLEDGHQLHRDWKFKLWISEELTAELQELYLSGKVDIVFLSMWQENSRYLNGLFGTSIPHIQIPRKLSESERGAKHRAIHTFLSGLNAHYGSIPAFGWADDVVTASEYGVEIHAEVGGMLENQGITVPPMLILNPDTTEGLRRSHWQQIVDFIDLHSVDFPVDSR